eukprot:Nk52_evm3s280 gene=Nk52_evmTU3s280
MQQLMGEEGVDYNKVESAVFFLKDQLNSSLAPGDSKQREIALAKRERLVDYLRFKDLSDEEINLAFDRLEEEKRASNNQIQDKKASESLSLLVLLSTMIQRLGLTLRNGQWKLRLPLSSNWRLLLMILAVVGVCGPILLYFRKGGRNGRGGSFNMAGEKITQLWEWVKRRLSLVALYEKKDTDKEENDGKEEGEEKEGTSCAVPDNDSSSITDPALMIPTSVPAEDIIEDVTILRDRIGGLERDVAFLNRALEKYRLNGNNNYSSAVEINRQGPLSSPQRSKDVFMVPRLRSNEHYRSQRHSSGGQAYGNTDERERCSDSVISANPNEKEMKRVAGTVSISATPNRCGSAVADSFHIKRWSHTRTKTS